MQASKLHLQPSHFTTVSLFVQLPEDGQNSAIAVQCYCLYGNRSDNGWYAAVNSMLCEKYAIGHIFRTDFL